MRRDSGREIVVLIGLLGAVFSLRAWRADQPILENYVGRQIPTAMVARNLERGSGFLHPQLETGPFPNLFLVEPPLAAQLAVWVSTGTRMPLDASGRILSAAGTTLAAWGLYGLMRRRRGGLAAVGAVIAFAAFPVTIRYGRAFQPDAVALGLLVAGLNCWDVPGFARMAAGAVMISAGLAQKPTWALSILPALLAIWPGRRPHLWLLALACVVPALAWYVRAGVIVAHQATGSAASIDNATNWFARLLAPGYLDPGRLFIVGRDFVIRSFTPLGFCLAVGSLLIRDGNDRLWRVWAAGGLVTLILLYGKLHHDYYWLLVAPAMAGCVGIALAEIAARSRATAGVAIVGLLMAGMIQSRHTWATPSEWRNACELGSRVAHFVPPDALVIGPESVIYLGDRRGCRLEWEPGSVRRAANEWRPAPSFAGESPGDLVRFYRRQAGARYFADLDNVPPDSPRGQLHESLRRVPGVRILEDRPGRFLVAEFAEPD